MAAFYGPKPVVDHSSLAGRLNAAVQRSPAKLDSRGDHDDTPGAVAVNRDSISTYDPSWREQIGDAAGRLVMHLGADRYGYQEANDKVRDIADFVPGLGTAVVGDETIRAARRGDYVGAGIGAATTVASLLPAGWAITSKALKAVRKPVRNAENAAKKLASRSVMIYDLPAKPLRDFALDYPKGAAADETERLRFDIEGRPLVAKYVVGRSMVGQPDQHVGPDGLVAIGTSLTRKGISGDSASNLGGGAGIATFDKHSRTPIDIRLGDWLTPSQQQRVLGHEAGHVIDEVAGQIPDVGLSRELKPLYNTLNTGSERTRNLTEPKHLGYRGEEVPREYMAEAMRAYMTDPNYFKTVAPRTAARIREYVNPHPQTRDVIQFNSLLGAGLLGYGMMPGDEESR